jgi:pyridoxamine 5'-phosphate oxidase family protein
VIRGIEVRGTAEALDDEEPPFAPQERAVIRIHPERVISWGIDGGSFDFASRGV